MFSFLHKFLYHSLHTLLSLIFPLFFGFKERSLYQLDYMLYKISYPLVFDAIYAIIKYDKTRQKFFEHYIKEHARNDLVRENNYKAKYILKKLIKKDEIRYEIIGENSYIHSRYTFKEFSTIIRELTKIHPRLVLLVENYPDHKIDAKFFNEFQDILYNIDYPIFFEGLAEEFGKFADNEFNAGKHTIIRIFGQENYDIITWWRREKTSELILDCNQTLPTELGHLIAEYT